MELTARPTAAWAALVLASACTPVSDARDRAAAVPPPSASRTSEADPGRAAAIAQLMPCQAGKLAPYAGAAATPPQLERMRAQSGAGTLRVVVAGRPMAMDLDTGRLTVETDAAGRILRASCG